MWARIAQQPHKCFPARTVNTLRKYVIGESEHQTRLAWRQWIRGRPCIRGREYLMRLTETKLGSMKWDEWRLSNGSTLYRVERAWNETERKPRKRSTKWDKGRPSKGSTAIKGWRASWEYPSVTLLGSPLSLCLGVPNETKWDPFPISGKHLI